MEYMLIKLKLSHRINYHSTSKNPAQEEDEVTISDWREEISAIGGTPGLQDPNYQGCCIPSLRWFPIFQFS